MIHVEYIRDQLLAHYFCLLMTLLTLLKLWNFIFLLMIRTCFLEVIIFLVLTMG